MILFKKRIGMNSGNELWIILETFGAPSKPHFLCVAADRSPAFQREFMTSLTFFSLDDTDSTQAIISTVALYNGLSLFFGRTQDIDALRETAMMLAKAPKNKSEWRAIMTAALEAELAEIELRGQPKDPL